MTHASRRLHTTRAILAAAAAAATPMFADDPITARWLNPVSGNWHDSANWSTHPNFPHSPDVPNAIIDAVGQPYTVTIGENSLTKSVAVSRLVLDSPDARIRTINSPGISAAEIHLNRGTLDLAQGGTISNAVITSSGDGRILAATDYDINLNRTTLGVPMTATGRNRIRAVEVTLNNTLSLGGPNFVAVGWPFSPQVINGTSEFRFIPDATPNDAYVSTVRTGHSSSGGFGAPELTLTIAPGISIRTAGGDGVVGGVDHELGHPVRVIEHRIISNGTVSAETPGNRITFVSYFTNNGTLRAANGGMLVIPAGTNHFVNNGTIRLDQGGTLALTGNANPARVGNLQSAGGTVRIMETLAHPAADLPVDLFGATTQLAFGSGSRIDSRNAATLADKRVVSAAADANQPLDVVGYTQFTNVTFDAPLRIRSGGDADFRGNTAINRTVTLEAGARVILFAPLTLPNVIDFDPAATLNINAFDLRQKTPSTAARDAAMAQYTSLLASALNGPQGRWTGPGITSSKVRFDATHSLALRAVSDTDFVVQHVYAGDANLDGKVSADDYFLIDTHFLMPPESPTYGQGDFNYDGKINADDYFMIDSGFLGQGPPLPLNAPSAPLAAVPVPEPFSLTLLLATACPLLLSRRSRNVTRTE